ncbi:unnamed protein product [Cladocopium goreaui]|uniref:Fe2OG dioxygenase domain-containing protein n=1 Tax=Cladocopium goreaui TaxID=2562237 RepID=A0A9P1G545_9DINO|nr:unnamed protein product [Cladocopium goreaui]
MLLLEFVDLSQNPFGLVELFTHRWRALDLPCFKVETPIGTEVVAGSIFDRVNKTIQITSPLCSSRKALMNDVFQLQGETDNGAPLFKSLRGNYLYHGPRCGIGQTGKKWIISPLLCSQGFSLAYRQTEDGTAPPLDDEWMVNCDRSGWQLADIQFSVVPMIGRIRTGASFCLEVFQRRAVLQPCNTDDAQLWIYNTSSGQLRDRNGLCLEAMGLPVLETQAIGIPVAMGDCLDDSSAQSWEYNTDSEQVKLKNLDQCLDAAQPDTIGGRESPYSDADDTGQCLSMHQPWASLLVYGFKRAEGRSLGDLASRLWIHATSKTPDLMEIQALEERYASIYQAAGVPMPPFPSNSGGYPTSALLGCVDVEACWSQSEYASVLKKNPDMPQEESESDFIFWCLRPRRLLVPLKMGGDHKIWRLEKSSLAPAQRGLQAVRWPKPLDDEKSMASPAIEKTGATAAK